MAKESLVPDYLLQAMEAAGEVAYDELEDSAVERVNLRRIEIPQRTSTKFAGAVGKIIITSGKEDDEYEEVDHIDFLLIDPLVLDRFSAPEWLAKNPKLSRYLPTGARTMWAFNPDGSRDQNANSPTCGSANGVDPFQGNFDKEIYDHRTGRTERIGWRFNTETQDYERLAHGCLGCPFADWHDKTAPLCGQTFTYVVWDIDRKEMLTIKGVNRGVQLALTGYNGNSRGRLYNGQPLPGIRYYFESNGQKDGVRTFRNRPEGKPDREHLGRPVYAVRMTVTNNNFDKPTTIPNFTLLDGSVEQIPAFGGRPPRPDGINIAAGERKLDSEDYAAYLFAVSEYGAKDYRSLFMGLNKIIHVEQSTAPELPASQAAHQLPSGQFDDVAEAEFTE